MAVDFGFWRNNTEDNSRVLSKNIAGTNSTNNGNAYNAEERVFDSKDIAYNYGYVEQIIGLDPNDEYDTPESVISKFFSNDPEMAEALRYEFTEFDEVTEAEIQRRQRNGMTRVDAIKSLDLDMDTAVSSPVAPKEEEVEVSTKPTLYKERKDQLLQEMLDTRSTGRFLIGPNKKDGSGFYNVLTNENLSSADIVALAIEYNKEDGSLVKALDYTFGNNSQNSETARDNHAICQEKYVAALIEQAKAGNEDAIKLLCQELHKATEAEDGIAELFLEEFFNQADEDTIKLVYENYGSANGGKSFYTVINNEKDLNAETRNKYINIIDKALRN